MAVISDMTLSEAMAYLVWLPHAVGAAFLYLFWVRMRGRSLGDLLARAEREHRRVHAVLAEHPRGGRWADYRAWMGDPP